MNHPLKIAVLLLIAGLVASCAIRPDDVLSNRQMERVLVDLHRAEGILQVAGYNYGHDAEVQLYYRFILERHGVTQAQFDSSLVWYTDHPAYFVRVYPRVQRDLKKLYDEEELHSYTNVELRARMERDSIHLQQEPDKFDVVAHLTWEVHRYHTHVIYTAPEPVEMFTVPIRREMERRKAEEKRRKEEEELQNSEEARRKAEERQQRLSELKKSTQK